MKNVAVIGAGVIGLSTALHMIDHAPDVSVTVIADKFGDATTSAVAPGTFASFLRELPVATKDAEAVRTWMRDSWDHFRRLAESEDAPVTGVTPVTGYLFSADERPLSDTSQFCYSISHLSQSELKLLSKGQHIKCGWKISTLMVECRWYLPWLMNRFKARGGLVEQKHITDITELQGFYDVIVNCAGIGSRELFDDDKLYSLRGQAVRLHAPWLKHFHVYMDKGPGICIGKEDVIIHYKETDKVNSSNTDVDAAITKCIMDKCQQMIPSLKHATLAYESVGLRPMRDAVRLETEDIITPKGTLKVIHNYGHGRLGVTLSWGCAASVTALLSKIFAEENTEASA